MSEWLKEHAWKAKWPKITERYRNTLLRNRFNDLPPPDAPRCDSVNVCIRRRFRAHLTQFLHSSRFRLPRPVSLDANFFRLTMAASCERVRECSSHRHGSQPCRTRDRASRRRDAGPLRVPGLRRPHGRSAAPHRPTARRSLCCGLGRKRGSFLGFMPRALAISTCRAVSRQIFLAFVHASSCARALLAMLPPRALGAGPCRGSARGLL